MVENSRRDRVGIGLIGLGPCWEQIYRQALSSLQDRLTVRVVYDSVESRARSIATEINAHVAGSLSQILSRGSLQGWLILDPGWCGAATLNRVAESGKPAFLATPALKHVSATRNFRQLRSATTCENTIAPSDDDCLMPELGLRYTPAVCRLRELIVTKLGPVTRIVVGCRHSSDIEQLAACIDLCTVLMGHPPRIPAENSRMSILDGIDLEFPSLSSAHAAACPRIARIQPQISDESSVQIEVNCERGRASLTSRVQISWSTALDSAVESLAAERSEVEILIDQFCRRALGGLNPVGRLSDFVRALEIARLMRVAETG